MTDELQSQKVQVNILGKYFGFSGPNAFPWFVVVVLLGGIGWLGYFSLGSWGQPIDLGKVIMEHQVKVSTEHKAFVDAIEGLTYVFAKCTDKKNINECPDVQMPESLRKKLRRD